MSADRGSDTEHEVIYVRLLDEGTEVWRPVNAKQLAMDLYCIEEETVPSEENWEFRPGTVVRVKLHAGRSGEFLAAISAVHFS